VPGIVVSTIAFLVAGFYLRRWAEANDMPRGMTLNVCIFIAAIAIAYGVGWGVDKIVALGGG
jgi:hypothetical protein